MVCPDGNAYCRADLFVVWLAFGPSPALTFALDQWRCVVLIIARPCARRGSADADLHYGGNRRGRKMGVVPYEALQLLKDAKVVAVDKNRDAYRRPPGTDRSRRGQRL